MAEFALLDSFLSKLPRDESVVLGVGDDAAVMTCPAGYQLVQTVDTMVSGVHFDGHFSPADIAHKLLHVNLSDIAAMGAKPKWATIALTMPSGDKQWLIDFSSALIQGCKENQLNLVGGDTTSGPLSISLQLTGLVADGKYLTRKQALVGDDIYVSGTLGDAALALALQADSSSVAPLNVNNEDREFLWQRLSRPQAQLRLGQALFGVANSCIDISDGLLADLGHICKQSGVGAELSIENLPLSSAYKNCFESEINYDYALNGGDDYQLCFTVSSGKSNVIQALIKDTSCKISHVGTIVADHQITPYLKQKHYQCQRPGWQHFAAEQ